jgi:FG-GAP repeat protein
MNNRFVLCFYIFVAYGLLIVPHVHAQSCGIIENGRFSPSSIDSYTEFGSILAIDGDRLAIAASKQDLQRDDEGAVYIYEFDGTDWVETAFITALDPDRNDRFGLGIALQDDLLAVCAPFDDQYGLDRGAVYIYRHSPTGWEYEQKIFQDNNEMNLYGAAVGIVDGHVLVGVPGDETVLNQAGAVYVYEYDGNNWGITSTLMPNKPSVGGQFGISMASDGNRIVVSDYPYNDVTVPSVFVFELEPSGWSQIGQMTSALVTPSALFGSALDLDDDLVIVGAPFDNTLGNYTGAIYVFREGISGWFLEQQILPSRDETIGLGSSVSISNDQIISGANASSVGSVFFRGSAHAFEYGVDGWQETIAMYNQIGQEINMFGTSVVQRTDHVIVGAPGENLWLGAVYEFDLNSIVPACVADRNGDCVLDIFDVSAFIKALGSQDPIADFNGDGRWNFFDISAFLSAFSAGCP